MNEIIQFLEKYKNLKWWQKILLFLPFLVTLVLVVIISIVMSKDDTSLKPINRNRKVVDDQIDKTKEYIDKLEEDRDKISKERDKTNKEIGKEYEKQLDETKRIRNANNSELKSIHQELRNRAKEQQRKN